MNAYKIKNKFCICEYSLTEGKFKQSEFILEDNESTKDTIFLNHCLNYNSIRGDHRNFTFYKYKNLNPIICRFKDNCIEIYNSSLEVRRSFCAYENKEDNIEKFLIKTIKIEVGDVYKLCVFHDKVVYEVNYNLYSFSFSDFAVTFIMDLPKESRMSNFITWAMDEIIGLSYDGESLVKINIREKIIETIQLSQPIYYRNITIYVLNEISGDSLILFAIGENKIFRINKININLK